MEEIDSLYLENENTLNTQTDNKMETNYWEQTTYNKPIKKKVTFNDILNNMNLVVSKDGVLQYMTPANKTINNAAYQDSQYYQDYQDSQNPNISQKPVDPNVKHSYIYNKYFKDYKEMVAPQQEPRRPKTIAELKQMMREDRIKEIQRRIRVAQIKPKTMLYTNTYGIQTNKNNLNRMTFG